MEGLDRWFASNASMEMYEKIKVNLKELELNVIRNIYVFYESQYWSEKSDDYSSASASHIHTVQSRNIFPTVDSYDKFRELIMPINTWHPRITRMVNELGLLSRVSTGNGVLGHGTGIILTDRGKQFCQSHFNI